MKSVEEHRVSSPEQAACTVITVSDTRTYENDESGKRIQSLLEQHNYKVIQRIIVKDDYEDIRELVYEAASDERVQAVLLTGGTGISGRDSTYEAVSSLLDKHLEGFGEIFRFLSFQEIGAAAMMSRAIGGTIGRTAVFSMPGSVHAVNLAMDRILLPELRHVIRELHK